MHNLDDNELDRLSRDAADQFEPDAAPPAWESLQKRLDEEMPIRKEGRDRKYWLLLLLLFLVAGGSAVLYYSRNAGVTGGAVAAYNGHSTGSASAKETEKASNTQQQAATTASSASRDSESATGARRENIDKAASSTSKEATNKESFNSSKQPGFNKNRSNERIAEQSGGAKIDGKGTGDDFGKAANNNIRRSKGNSGNVSGEAMLLTDVSFFHVAGLNSAPKDFSFSSLNATNPHLNNAEPVAATASSKEKKLPPKDNFRPFEIGVVVGPDKSQVHGTTVDQSGYNLGLFLGYNFSRRWQINTGLIYNKKYYNAKGEDYHPPKGYWTDTVYLSMVNGNCMMWDLPVNVRYNVLAKKNHSLFASAGLSTYFMKTEGYGYHYYYYTGQYGYKYKSTPTNDAYWFSIGNLSAGYEQNFGAFSIQAEPYVKFALKGVGMGSVDLNSYGMNILLKYKPNWSIKKANPQTK